ncbi:MAG: CHRD domain-containing protein [Nostocaceae cyanobacterium]|nr:CHRD domain-containing protein [Nostocaceae cyanobacterium]
MKNRHKYLLGLAAAMIPLAIMNPVQAATLFTTNLNSDLVPDVDSNATGSASFILNDAEDELKYEIEILGDIANLGLENTGNKVTKVHLHVIEGDEFRNGEIFDDGKHVFNVYTPDDNDLEIIQEVDKVTFKGMWDANDFVPENPTLLDNRKLVDQLDNLFTGNLFVNVHTVDNPSSEIRGIIKQVPEYNSSFAFLIAGCTYLLWNQKKLKKTKS